MPGERAEWVARSQPSQRNAARLSCFSIELTRGPVPRCAPAVAARSKSWPAQVFSSGSSVGPRSGDCDRSAGSTGVPGGRPPPGEQDPSSQPKAQGDLMCDAPEWFAPDTKATLPGSDSSHTPEGFRPEKEDVGMGDERQGVHVGASGSLPPGRRSSMTPRPGPLCVVGALM